MCASKLRREGSCAKTIHIMIFTNPFKKDNNINYRGYKKITLDTPTNDGLEIVARSMEGLKSIYKSNCIYKKAGVIVSDIVPESQVQLSLFHGHSDAKKRKDLMTAIDTINDHSNKMNIRFAINGWDKKKLIKQKRLSPCYTTQLSDLLRI